MIPDELVVVLRFFNLKKEALALWALIRVYWLHKNRLKIDKFGQKELHDEKYREAVQSAMMFKEYFWK
jgi:hypothetical protein